MPMTSEEYVACGGQVCPFCGDHNIEGESVDFDCREVWQTVKCYACEKEWLDIYTLTHFVEC